MNKVVPVVAAIVAAFIHLLHYVSPVLAYGEGDSLPPPAQREPRNIRCPEDGTSGTAFAPYYLYRFPVLISDDAGDTRDWYGWYYANGCAFTLDAAGRAIGLTYANLPVDDLHPFDAAILRDFIAANNAILKPVQDALPAVGEAAPGLRTWTVPDPARYSAAFRALLQIPFSEPLPTLAVPQLRDKLLQAGFVIRNAPSELGRNLDYILLDTSRNTVGERAVIDWWDLHGRGAFYNFDPAGAAASPGTDGGVMRVILNPVDWEVRAAEQMGRSQNGTATIRADIRLARSSKQRQTLVAWRWKDEGGAWRAAGSADLAPYGERVLTFQVSAPDRPRVLEVAANPHRDAPAHELTFANNYAEVTVQPEMAHDLSVRIEAPATYLVDAGADPNYTVALHAANDGNRAVSTRVYLAVRWPDGGASDREFEVTLAPHERKTITTTVGAMPGQHTLTATIDPAGLVPDPNRANNTDTTNVAVRLPESTVTGPQPQGVCVGLAGGRAAARELLIECP